MTRRAYFYFVLTFLLGVVVGGSGVFFYGWYGGHWHRVFGRQRFVRQLTEKLELSEDQVHRIIQIMDDTQKQMDLQLGTIRQQTRDRIRQTLTSAQVAKFDEILREHDERHRRLRSP